jgi:DNA (cytosine-5)-methyltransferase 1
MKIATHKPRKIRPILDVLNLYAGLGGNRKLWEGVNVTAVESNLKIAEAYQEMYPNDRVVVMDAHEFLLQYHDEFDFIWSSPPCQSHSKMVKATRHDIRKYPDMRLYEEIIFLRNFSKARWVIENVRPYYDPIIKPTKEIGRHIFWSNFRIEASDVKSPKNFINKGGLSGAETMKKWLGINYSGSLYYGDNHCPTQVLRNCVHPEIGRQILDCAKGLASIPLLSTIRSA